MCVVVIYMNALGSSVSMFYKPTSIRCKKCLSSKHSLELFLPCLVHILITYFPSNNETISDSLLVFPCVSKHT